MNRLLAEVGKRGRGKGSVFSLDPLTFTLFPPLAKNTFARGLIYGNDNDLVSEGFE